MAAFQEELCRCLVVRFLALGDGAVNQSDDLQTVAAGQFQRAGGIKPVVGLGLSRPFGAVVWCRLGGQLEKLFVGQFILLIGKQTASLLQQVETLVVESVGSFGLFERLGQRPVFVFNLRAVDGLLENNFAQFVMNFVGFHR